MSKHRFLLCAAVGITLAFMLVLAEVLTVSAQATATFTPSPSPTYTSTFTNAERIDLATIKPPPSCGLPYSPCGALPWSAVKPPVVVLPSPTLIDLNFSVPTTGPGTPTATVTPTTTPLIDNDPVKTLSQSIGNISGTLQANPTAVFEVNGTPVTVQEMGYNMGQNISLPFAFMRAVHNGLSGLGLTWAFINFLLISVGFTVIVYVITFVAPIVLGLIGFVLRVITAIKPF